MLFFCAKVKKKIKLCSKLRKNFIFFAKKVAILKKNGEICSENVL
jgi:hypothetical protein